jgi:bifunctional enzyme CysN/CysC
LTTERLIPHPPRVVWFTGLPGAGKSTIASLVLRELQRQGVPAYVLDGDDVRGGLNCDLGFGDEDRTENVRRVAHVARMMVEAGLFVLVALVTPFAKDRRAVRVLLGELLLLEVFVDVPQELAADRDPKGLYQRARRGELSNFTGIDSRYEVPEAPDLHLQTDQLTENEAADCVVRALTSRGANLSVAAETKLADEGLEQDFG